ncbi:peptidyl-prolyl cis-trans isomerase [Fragilaria crotonensis]|nr:peptidyl-prolyl cis-trans isomerase [Fragilaria crotonensis]
MPKSIVDKIVHAIRNQPKSPNGVSRVAITKYLKSELGYDNPAALKRAIKKAVDTGVIEQFGQSFKVKGDPVEIVQPEVQVEVHDVVVGDGEIITESGDSLTVKYVGKLEDGTTFDAESTFEFTLGAGDVIKGWDQGLLGMKVGGQRKLVVPPKLGYGKRGCGFDIPPSSTLHFVIDLKKVRKPSS